MNIRWLKQNLTLALAGVVFVALLGGLIWLEHRATSAQNAVQEELESQQARLAQLQGLAPYPSQDNIKVVQTDHAQLQRLHAKLQQAVTQKQVNPPDAKSPIAFAQYLRRTVDSLEDQAQRGGLIVPTDFKFGFSQYASTLPCRSPGVKADDCLQLLGKQLLIVERLTMLLISSQVYELNHIHRTEVEPGAGADALASPPARSAKSLHEVTPFDLQFTCTPDALQTFINSVSQADMFFVIRNLKAEAQTAAKPGEQRRLVVNMRLDVIEFPPPKTEGGKPTPKNR